MQTNMILILVSAGPSYVCMGTNLNQSVIGFSMVSFIIIFLHPNLFFFFLNYFIALEKQLVSLTIYSFIEFRSGKSPLLVATDVASRGLGMLTISFKWAP